MTQIIGQAIGIVAMAFNILSFQGKKARSVMLTQLCGASLFAISYFMIGAAGAGLLNLIAVLRAAVYSNKERFCADSNVWLIVFTVLYIASYVLAFTVFGKSFTLVNALVEVLPVIALTITTFGFKLQNAKIIRRFGIVNSVCWLIYNIVNIAIGGIICEVLSLGSIAVGMVRHDRKGA